MKGWRTIAFNVVSGLIALAQTATGKNVIPEEYLALAVVVGNVVLRILTTTPVGQAG